MYVGTISLLLFYLCRERELRLEIKYLSLLNSKKKCCLFFEHVFEINHVLLNYIHTPVRFRFSDKQNCTRGRGPDNFFSYTG